ncbi:hypothetical protein WN56_02505 [Salinivibrio sp. KP-1]|nr:hypothetical protein WN56_02505 [Salinivibrio sp. KP-1]
MKRLDYLIGRDHWLSVGNYKEELLRNLLRNLLPKKYEVSTGFILSLDQNGNELKSKQQDIIIWNSNEFSAIFRDDEFVIVPPEACQAVIEVKSTLTKNTLKKAMLASDDLYKFMQTPSLYQFKIAKFIFSFGSDLKFPDGYFDTICEFYDNDKDGQLSATQRQEFTKEFFSQESSGNFTIDGIFSLNDGSILREIALGSDKKFIFIFRSFDLISNEVNHVYTFFEHIIHSEVNSPNSKHGFYYSKQPGLFSLMSELSLKTPEEGGTLVYPYTDSIRSVNIKDLYKGNRSD